MSANLKNLTDRGRSLAALGQSAGKPFAYQWAIPGRNARPVMSTLSAALAGVVGSTTLHLYSVPQGMRFFMTGVIVQLFGDGWQIGSDALVMSFLLEGASAERPVQYLNNIRTPLGSVNVAPFPLPVALEFNALDVLTGQFSETGIVPAGGNLLMGVFGYEVPESESFL